MRQTELSDSTAGLADGRVDVALLRVPFHDQHRFRVEVLLREDRWVTLPESHRLAPLERIPFRELWAEPFIALPVESGIWRDYWLATDERAGHPVNIAAVASNPDAFLAAAAAGTGISLTPASTPRFYSYPGVVHRPVDGVSQSQVAVVRREDSNDPVVNDFVLACLEHKE